MEEKNGWYSLWTGAQKERTDKAASRAKEALEKKKDYAGRYLGSVINTVLEDEGVGGLEGGPGVAVAVL